MDSILDSIKKLLGLTPEYTAFDDDIIIHINTAFGILNQLGVGPAEGFMIENHQAEWEEYITSCNLLMIRSYIYLKVRTLFDPPSSSVLMESINRQLSELEWRIQLEVDPIIEEETSSDDESDDVDWGD